MKWSPARGWSTGWPSGMVLNWNRGKHAKRCRILVWRTRRLWLWLVLRKVMLRPASERSWARLSMEFTCPCAGSGKMRTCGAFDSGSMWARSRVLIAKTPDLLGIISFLANGLGWNPLTHNPSHRHQAQLLQAVHHHQPLIKTQIIRHHQQALPSPTYQTKKGVFIHSKQIKGTKELLGFCFQCQAR